MVGISVLPYAASAEGRLPSACIVVEAAEGGSPIIAARVNGRGPFGFVLDTGSSSTTLDELRTKQLGLVPNPAPEQGQGMGGAVDVRVFRLHSVATGSLVVRDLDVPGVAAPQIEGRDIAGLGGVDLFGSRLAVWRLERGCVQVRPSGARPGGRGWRRIESRWLKPWKILVPVRIGRAAGWGLLDTGSQRTILSPAFARLAGLRDGGGGGTVTGVDGRETALSAFVLPEATIGRWRFVHPTANVANLPVFGRLGGANEALAIVGMDWIGTRPFAIDYGRRQVWQAAR